MQRRQWQAALFHLDRVLEAQPGNPVARAKLEEARRNLAGAGKPIIPARDPQAGANLVNLSAWYNASLDRGWQNPTNEANNLSALPRGLQTFGGVPFDVRGVIQLRGLALKGLGVNFPEQVRGLVLNHPGQRLHFLHGTGWTAEAGVTIGSFVIRYANGYELRIPILYGRDVLGWWRFPNEKQEAIGPASAWTGENEAAKRAGASLRIFKTTWVNPLPSEAIKSIDYVSAMTAAAPFLLAVTVE